MSTQEKLVVMNIVNQLADLWKVPVDVRQKTNDKADQFVKNTILSCLPKEIPDLNGKYESDINDGVGVDIDENDEQTTGDSLVKLAEYAEDIGYNKAINDVREIFKR